MYTHLKEIGSFISTDFFIEAERKGYHLTFNAILPTFVFIYFYFSQSWGPKPKNLCLLDKYCVTELSPQSVPLVFRNMYFSVVQNTDLWIGRPVLYP